MRFEELRKFGIRKRGRKIVCERERCAEWRDFRGTGHIQKKSVKTFSPHSPNFNI
jgi:hypothetical protein